MSSYLPSDTACSRNIPTNPSGIDNDSRLKFLNASLAVSLPLLDHAAGAIYSEEVFNIIWDPNFDGRLFSSQTSFIENCDDISTTIVHSTYSND